MKRVIFEFCSQIVPSIDNPTNIFFFSGNNPNKILGSRRAVDVWYYLTRIKIRTLLNFCSNIKAVDLALIASENV